MSDNKTILTVNNLAKFFGRNKVLKDINLDVKKGDVISIIVYLKHQLEVP